MKQNIAVLLAVLLVWTQMPAQSAEQRTPEPKMQVSWQDLSTVTAGKLVTIILPDGAEVRGHVLSVEPGELVLNITKTSDKNTHPKGRTSIPRVSVTTLSFVQSGHGWRVAGTAIGFVAGCGAAVPAAQYSENEGGAVAGAAIGIVAATATVGYFLGRSADRKIITIRVKN